MTRSNHPEKDQQFVAAVQKAFGGLGILVPVCRLKCINGLVRLLPRGSVGALDGAERWGGSLYSDLALGKTLDIIRHDGECGSAMN